ncbi:carbohydrate sulfotransferase 11-like [Vespa velutina]|uniref:carbohydrate sulfotransferase 11-like n=1 Tax=Vespa velutina TaxID=202808 RepID=UPI001FB2F97E|nr:carbohydrate sulfotransferase 11-like [Vespa velutina]
MVHHTDNKNLWLKFMKFLHFYIKNKIILLQKKVILQLIIIFTILFTLLITLEKPWHNLSEENNEVEAYSIAKDIQQYTEQYDQKLEKIIVSNLDIVLSSTELTNKRIELNGRRQKIKNMCKNYTDKELQQNRNFPNIIIDTKHGISWCPIYKVGSSTWMKNFAILAGILTDTTMNLIHQNAIQMNTIVKQAFPSDLNLNKTLKKLRATKKFLIVRHPFERLLSAYRDKLEHMNGREYYYKRFGRHITHKYRKHKNSTRTKLEPTFEEFLEFIVHEKYFDEHWAPYYDTCKPCMIHYDYILKFETFQEDHRFFMQETGLKYYLYKKSGFKNINPHGRTTSNLLRKYLENIPKLLLQKIYKIYEKDFKLFSYFPDLY